MPSSRPLALGTSILILACGALSVGCADSASDEVDTSGDELKKRIGGESGQAAVVVPAGALGTAPFVNHITMRLPEGSSPAEVKLVPGQSIAVVPSTYSPFFQGQDRAFRAPPGAFTLVSRMIPLPSVPVAAGEQKSVTGISCVTFTTSKPVDFGAPHAALRLTAGASWVEQYVADIELSQLVDSLDSEDGLRVLVPTGPIAWRLPFGATKTATASEQKCVEQVLKTRTFGAVVDPIDPGYPDSNAHGASENVFMKVGDAKMHPREFGTRTFLHGLKVEAWAWGTQVKVGDTATKPVRFNRLEVDDLEETLLDGTKVKRSGWFKIKRIGASPSSPSPLDHAVFLTHSGVDLLDGRYEVEISAQGTDGVLSSRETVSFP